MKTLKLLALVVLAFTLSRCDDELFDIKFSLKTASGEFTIQPTTQVGEITLDTMVYKAKIDSLAKAYKTDTLNLKSVKVKKLTFTILSPADMDFDAVNSGEIKLFAPGKPEITVAEFKSVPKDVKTFEITPLDVDLLPYAKKESLSIYAKIVTNAAIEVPIKLKLDVDFDVVANPLKKKKS